MDKKQYYRLLGVREDATPAQIKAAYEDRLSKLKAADYNDDPEYARKRSREISEAYRILTGHAPSVRQNEKRDKFEKIRDRMEKGEGNSNTGPFRSEDTRERADRFSDTRRPMQREGTTYRPRGRTKKILIAVIAFIILGSLIRIIVGGLGAFIGNISTEIKYFFNDYEIGEDFDYDEIDELKKIEEAKTEIGSLDYYSKLDTSTKAANNGSVDWDAGVDKYGEGGLFTNSMQVIFSLGISDPEFFFEHVTGIDDYYSLYDDAECANAVIGWMAAPSFEDVAGSTNLYTQTPILSLDDYVSYLGRLVYENQNGF